MLDKWLDTVQQGDCIELMRQLPAESIHFCMFSPPYWGLRDYGIEGQIGLEPTYQEYVVKMVEVGREIRRVLRGDGSWYLNLGDTFFGDSPVRTKSDEKWERTFTGQEGRRSATDQGPKPKCKLLIPYRVALALIDDGWTVRNDITWYKPNAMPSSVKDRLTCQTERVFHLVKSRKYYYDLDAIREPHKNIEEIEYRRELRKDKKYDVKVPSYQPAINPGNPLGKNPGDFWPITTKSFPEAHFAVYPEALCERPIRSSCPAEVCVKCGRPRERITRRTNVRKQRPSWRGEGNAYGIVGGNLKGRTGNWGADFETVGWTDCNCGAGFEAGIVLDPMCGAGTTIVVAKKLGRHFMGFDLKPDYCEMTRKWLSQVEWPLNHFAGEEV